MSHRKFSNERYEEIKKEVLYMFEETETTSIPIDCFAIAEKLHIRVVKYSELPLLDFYEATEFSENGFSRVELDSDTGMYRYVIYYNDEGHCIGNIRMTIFRRV